MKTMCLLCLAACLTLSAAAITIDGKNITGDFANASWATYQNVASDWGAGSEIMAMYVMTNGTHLLVGVPCYLANSDGRCLVLFIDGNPATGSNVLSGITACERTKNMNGMSFDPGFTPDRAVSLGVNGGASAGSEGYPHLESIVGNQTEYQGLMTDLTGAGAALATNGRSFGAFIPGPWPLDMTNTADTGIEFAIPYTDLLNSSPTVNLMAISANLGGDWAPNQTLAPSGGNSNWASSVSSAHHADLVPGLQYISVIIPTSDTNVYLFATASKNKGLAFSGSSEIELTASAAGGTPPYSFLWDLGNGVTTAAQNFTYVYPAAAADADYAATVNVSDSGALSTNLDTGNTHLYAATAVDGLDITNTFAGATNVLQDTASNWGVATVPGSGNELKRLYARSIGEKLYVGICGNLATGIGENVLGVFIDSDYAAGSNVMPLVTAGSPAKLQNLEGMTFDAGFTPDKALLLSINTPGDCWVDVYHIDQISNEWYWGTKTEWMSIFAPFQRVVNDRFGTAGDVVAFNDLNTAAAADATTGLEAYLDYATLNDGGLVIGDKVKLQAIIYNHANTNVANQSLPGINGNAAGFGVASNVNYETVPGLQYIEVDAPIPEPVYALFAAGLLLMLRRK